MINFHLHFRLRVSEVNYTPDILKQKRFKHFYCLPCMHDPPISTTDLQRPIKFFGELLVTQVVGLPIRASLRWLPKTDHSEDS